MADLEMTLYRAHCEADGQSNFQPTSNPSDDVKKRIGQAIETVRKYMGYSFGLHNAGTEGFLESEDQAKGLIAYLKDTMEGVDDSIDIVKCMHGRIVFDRKIVFSGRDRGQIDELIAAVKKAKYEGKEKVPDYQLKRSFQSDRFW